MNDMDARHRTQSHLKTDRRAVQSLVLGIASLVFALMFIPLFPVTLVMAVLAIRKGRPTDTGKGSAAGVLLGWISIGIVALMLAFFVFIVALLMMQ